MRPIQLRNQIWLIALLLFVNGFANAQCLEQWSFKNVNDIPVTCGVPWMENGITMQMNATTPSTSCSSGSGCVFDIIEFAPNQYNFLQILSGEFQFNIPDPTAFHAFRFQINGSGCEVVRYYNGNQLVLEETPFANYYYSNPNTTAGLTFDNVRIAVSNSSLYNFQIFSVCDDGAPATSPNISWEEFPQNAYGGTGSSGPFLNSQGVDIYVSDESGAMLPPAMAQYFINSTLESAFGHGENFYFSNHGVKFDFSVLANPILAVYFDVPDALLDYYIKVNDENTYIGTLEDPVTTLAPGFTVTNLGTLGRTTGKRFLLEGNGIASFVIGGPELMLDNISFVQGQQLNCSINDFQIQNIDCNSDGTFDLDFYMLVEDAPSQIYSYYIDGVMMGAANWQNGFNTVTDLVATNGMNHTFYIEMLDDPNCNNEFVFYLPNCIDQSCLEFAGFAEYGENYGNIPGDTVALLTDNGVVATVQNYYNGDSSIIDFQRLVVLPNTDLLLNPENINLDLDLTGINGTVNSLSFDVGLGCCVHFGFNNEYYFVENWNQFPTVLPSDYIAYQNGNSWTIEGPNIEHFSFGGGNIFIGNFCYTTASPLCEVNNGIVETLDCNNTGQFAIDIDFDYSGNTDSFEVIDATNNYGTFAYADLPITIEGFEGDDSSTYYLIVEDLLGTCTLDLPSFGPIDCTLCSIDNLQLVENFCTDTNPFVLFSFNTTNPDGNIWEWWLNDNYQGTSTLYANGSGEEIVTNYSDLQDVNNEIRVCLVDNPDCCESVFFDLDNCNFCTIENMAIEVLECDPNEQFYVEITSITGDSLGPTFVLTGNGINYGTYPYTSLPILVGPFDGSSNSTFQLIATDLDAAPDCNYSVTFGPPTDCSSCDLDNPSFTLTDCDPFARFSAIIDFDYGDLTGGFAVYQNGIYVGNYEYADLPITRQGFEGDGVTEHTVVIQHESDADCTLTIDIGIVNCDVQCALLEFIVFQQSCNPDGTVNITFSMIPVNTNSTEFEASLNGVSLGTYQVSPPNHVYTFTNVDINSNAENELNICMIDGPTCCETTIFDGIECDGASCSIDDLAFVEINCDGGGLFGSISFDAPNATSDSFNYWINGEFIDSRMLTTGGFYGINIMSAIPGILNTLEVCITNNPDCCSTIGFEALDCHANCEIDGLEIEILDCSADGVYAVNLDFSNENASDSFSLNGNGINYGNFAYADLPIQIGGFIGNGTSAYELIAYDLINVDCQDFVEFGPFNCTNTQCEISDLVFNNIGCDGDVAFASIFFEVENPGNDFFEYWINGAYQDQILLNGGNTYDIILEDLNPSIINSIQVCINDQPDCCSTLLFDYIDCTTDCSISSLEVEIMDCLPDNVFSVNLDFESENTSDSFNLVGNGNNYGNYAYADLPIQLNNFVGDGTTVYEFGVIDLNDPSCQTGIEFGPVDCGSNNCSISDLELSEFICEGGILFANLFFEVDNPGNDFFEYWVNGVSQQTRPLNSSNNYTVALVGLDPFIDNSIQVCINDQPDCCSTLFFDYIDCTTDCSISSLEVEIMDCLPDNVFSVNLDFESENTSDSFNLVGNGNNYGNYAYADLPIQLNNFVGDGTTVYEFGVIDLNDPSCQTGIEFGPVDCGSNNCSISDLELSEFICEGDILFANLFFEVDNPSNDFFEYWVNGVSQQTHPLNSSNNYTVALIGLDPFIDNTIQVCINDQPDCCSTLFFDYIDCTTDCSISSLEVEIMDCLPDNIFSVNLDFESENTSDSFNLVGNGNNYGNYAYADLPIQLNNFVGDGTTVYEFGVIDLNDPSCQTGIEFGPVDCGSNNCSISDLELSEFICDGGTLYANLFFEVDNPGNDFFEYWINGEYQDLVLLSTTNTYVIPLEDIEPFIDNSIQVCINDQPDCCSTLFFEYIDCSSDCSISEMEVAIMDCLPDNTFSVILDFEYENTSDSFALQGNGFYYGNYAYADLPFQIGFFIGDGSTEYELIASDLGDDSCQGFVEFGPWDCSIFDCTISDLILTEFECDGDELFANLFFEVISPGNNFFEYWVNDEYVDLVELQSDNNYTIALSNYDPTALNILQVCINDQPDCCSSISFDGIDCNPDSCSMENLMVSGAECLPDGTAGLNISFDHDYPLDDQFEIYLDDELLGTFNFSQVPFTLLHVEIPANGAGIVQVNPEGLPDCALEQMVGIANCEESFCMDFNDLSEDLSFTSNNISELPLVLFEQEEVVVSLANCGEPDFLVAEVRNPDYCQTVPFGDNAFYVQSAALEYDFSDLVDLPNSLTFEYCGEGEISINGLTNIAFGNDQAGIVVTQNGFTVESHIITDVAEHGYVSISGSVSELTICGTETSLGPVCYETTSTPSGDECYGFENLIDGGFYPIGTVDPLIYQGNGFNVTLEDGYYTDGFLGITSTAVPPPFNAAINNYAILRGGLNFDFSDVSEPIEFLSFDFSGTAFEVVVNNVDVAFDGLNPLDSLVSIGNGVVLYYSRESSNNWEGSVNIFGNVESLIIIGDEIKLDNFCYYLNILNSDVWPGDINSDNIADHCDLLYLGIANGTMGPERNTQTDNWAGQLANDWDQAFEFESTNYKHADANGDGIINEEDVEVLALNLNKVHGPLPAWNGTLGTVEDPPLYVDLNANGPLIAGSPFSVPIMLGTFDKPVEDIYGLAFSIEFSADDLDLSNTSLTIDDSWLGSELWKIENVNQTDGRIDIGMTRIGLQDTTGFGSIASFTGIIEDLVGKIIEVDITNIKALSHDETEVLIFAQGTSGTVTTNTEKDALEDGLHIFPIPTGQWLHVRNYNDDEINLVRIYNVLGQTMLTDMTPQAINQYDLNQFVSGVYFIELEFDGTTIVRKIEVFE